MIINRSGPLLPSVYAKDPCPVFDGNQWHIFGSTPTGDYGWAVLHAVSEQPEGPYTRVENCQLPYLASENVCAPGVIYEDGLFHMFIQTEYYRTEGIVAYLTSTNGNIFHLRGIPLRSVAGGHEAGIYDPHPALIDGERYLTYSGFAEGPRIQGDIYLAKSRTNTWAGPWERLGKILRHEDVPGHNQKDHPDYEWGLEGSCMVQLPEGRILLLGVMFGTDSPRGTRQRAFGAIGTSVLGPFTLDDFVHVGTEEWESGETGHAAAIRHDDQLLLFYQARPPADGKWNYGMGTVCTSFDEEAAWALKAKKARRRAVEEDV